MDFLKIRSGGPRSEEKPFSAKEAVVLWVLLKKGWTYLNELIRDYNFHPQGASRVLGRLRERGFISSEWHGQLRVYEPTREGKDWLERLVSHQPVLSSNFEPLKVPRRGRIINAGGGTCEIARRFENELYHVHFPFRASMLIPPWPLYARAIKGTPFIFFGNEDDKEN